MHRTIVLGGISSGLWGILSMTGGTLAQEQVPNALSFTVEGQAITITPVPGGSAPPAPVIVNSLSGTPPGTPGTVVSPGLPLEPSSPISAGTRLAAEWSGRWLAVDVLEIKPDGRIRVHWVGWGNNFDEDMDRARLRFPADATRPADSTSSRRSSRPRMVPVLPPEFVQRDRNGDGQIGMYEWERGKYSEFAKLDKNGDGFLTPQELTAKGNAISSRLRGGRLEREAQPNPGNLSSFGQRIGETLVFSVTGRVSGAVYGTAVYTTDSDLASAAVHAGIVKDGEQGVVQVTIVETPNQFSGTSANGVMSRSWGSYPTAFTFK